jgi:hypothetical protein
MAARLIQAEWDRATIAPFSDADLGIDIEAAYAAQWALCSPSWTSATS